MVICGYFFLKGKNLVKKDWLFFMKLVIYKGLKMGVWFMEMEKINCMNVLFEFYLILLMEK